MKARMQQHTIGQKLLAERPRVTEASVDLPRLRALPPSTFGCAYARYIDSYGFSPDGRSPVKFVQDDSLAYVMQRYREIHDFLHALTGLTPSVDDEVTLKWFEMVQTELPLCALSAFVGPARLPPARLQHLLLRRIPWAARVATAAPFVMNVYYEQHFDESIDDLRKELRLEQAPWNVQPPAI